MRGEFYLSKVLVLKMQEGSWGACSVGEGQTSGPKFDPRNPHQEKLVMKTHSCDSSS